MPARRVVVCLLSLVVFLRWPAVARGQNALSGPAIHITRAIGTITVDGDLSDEAWRTATRIEQWYEVNPGDNVEPKVKNVGLCVMSAPVRSACRSTSRYVRIRVKKPVGLTVHPTYPYPSRYPTCGTKPLSARKPSPKSLYVANLSAC
jgi:hypothetical protein